jgi:mannose-6-phosphate isomerase-like protein (cupin superfamily)
MRIIRAAECPLVPASHEDPRSPGVLKRVLLSKADFQPGTPQMVNWAVLPAGRSFAAHYHEDMQEIFVIVQGTAEMRVGPETVRLESGDTIAIDAREVHQMSNHGDHEIHYVVVGISGGQNGRTVVVPDWR